MLSQVPATKAATRDSMLGTHMMAGGTWLIQFIFRFLYVYMCQGSTCHIPPNTYTKKKKNWIDVIKRSKRSTYMIQTYKDHRTILFCFCFPKHSKYMVGCFHLIVLTWQFLTTCHRTTGLFLIYSLTWLEMLCSTIISPYEWSQMSDFWNLAFHFFSSCRNVLLSSSVEQE